MRCVLLLLSCALWMPMMAAGATVGTQFWIAPNGRDANPGTRAKPFATLERARDAIRELKKTCGLPPAGVTVWLRGGIYTMSSGFTLSAEDSGSVDAPVTYRSCQGEEARLIGGRVIDGFKPVRDTAVLARLDEAARAKVLQVDLKAHGITDYGEMTVRGWVPIHPAGLELFCEDRPMPLASWPNGGWAITKGAPAGSQGGRFSYEEDRPGRWAKSDDIWVHGYWTYPWADSYVHVKSIDTEKREIETYAPHGVGGYAEGKRWRVLNVLEELDQPGEWYLDRKAGLLYFWPPEPLRKGAVIVSTLDVPMIALAGVSHVTFRGLTVECTRGVGFEIAGGTDCRVAGCVLRNMGTCAVSIKGGSSTGVLGCDILHTGEGAIILEGGDRNTLTPAGNYAVNNRISDYNYWVATYRPAVFVTGVGNHIAHNLMFDSPHSAILLAGNDHVVEFNEVHSVCKETGDAGAFYMGRDWTQRGNVVRYNYFHDLGMYEDKFSPHGFSETMAVYLDDWSSGTRVFGNVCRNVARAVLVGGGRDNTVENNVFIDCKVAVHIDARGLGWAKNYFDGTVNTLFDRLKEVNGTQPPYSIRYPQLATILQDEPAVPKGNVVARNICAGGTSLQILDGDKFDNRMLDIHDNFTEGDPGFVNAAKGDFSLKPDAPALKIGFRRIPIDRIGIFEDEYRAELPH